MVDATKELHLFGIAEFRPGCGILEDLVEELPVYHAIIDVTLQSFWSAVQGAANHDASLKKKAKKDPEKYGGSTWKEDRIEKARRVWEWWHAKAVKFHSFFTTVRYLAIVLSQSASMERVFS